MQPLRIVPMLPRHVYRMTEWGKNTSPLLESYDFWPATREACDFWYAVKTASDRNRYFAVVYGGDVIAYVSIKNMRFSDMSAELGIVLDPRYQDMGFGRRILTEFLEQYRRLGFRILRLTVDRFNARAIALYRSLGFQIKGSTLGRYDGDARAIPPCERKNFIICGRFALSWRYKMEVHV